MIKKYLTLRLQCLGGEICFVRTLLRILDYQALGTVRLLGQKYSSGSSQAFQNFTGSNVSLDAHIGEDLHGVGDGEF
jgi:hypothetical protein